MPIYIALDFRLLRRGMSLAELSRRTGITVANLSIIKNNKGKAIRLSTLDALCRVLEYQPGYFYAYWRDPTDSDAAVPEIATGAPSSG